ncbi:hypothetical protein K2173_008260 [Erythroxylum novogranatense]|uniref:DUF4218 domain-containing protein n=1 Tax=Erythroxylum novogranatense TaxID=1862640 RepID=A0AAV8U3B7_9ROSI|nr:hypothetical protein K2173_008260 [Erythroxylum novogranatense]
MVRHNLDVMHIKKNMFDNLFNTIMNIEGRTKDNAKSRADLQLLCRRHELHKDVRTGKYPKACYTLDKQQKESLCEWLKGLKFPDGYVSNLSRLIPIAFRELLPSKVWEPLTELSLFFKSLTSSEINLDEMEKLENEIPVIVCKLEGIIPLSLFDCMEHLPVFTSFKKNVKNKARVEGPICNAYLVKKASMFCGHYFEPHVRTRARQVPRNDDGGGTSGADENLSIFTYPRRTSERARRRMLTEEEIDAAHGYILLNCQEVLPFVHLYEALLHEIMPGITQDDMNNEVGKQFPRWFARYAVENSIQNKFIFYLVKGPLRTVYSYPVYFVNGYKYHTESHGHTMSSMNSEVSIQGELMDYYGKIIEILEVEYPVLPIK